MPEPTAYGEWKAVERPDTGEESNVVNVTSNNEFQRVLHHGRRYLGKGRRQPPGGTMIGFIATIAGVLFGGICATNYLQRRQDAREQAQVELDEYLAALKESLV